MRLLRKWAVVDEGQACSGILNECAAYRRDFSVYGFKLLPGSEQNAVEKWEEAYGRLVQGLEGLQADASVSEAGKGHAGAGLENLTKYKEAFEELTKARKLKDDGFASWGDIGWAITDAIGKAKEEVIAPALQEAFNAGDLTGYERWSSIDDSFSVEVIERFLVLRINAIYLVATNADAQWASYLEQLKKMEAGLGVWSQKVAGIPALTSAAEAIEGSLEQYAQAGQNFHQGIVQERDTDKVLVASAQGVVGAFDGLGASLAEDMQAIIVRTNALALA